MSFRTNDPLTPERARQLLDYNRETGLLRWRIDRRGGIVAGDEAGGFDARGLVIVTVDNRVYTATRLIWLMVRDDWPKGRIRFRNGKTDDLRFANLVDESDLPPPTENAARQRQHRDDAKAVNEILDNAEGELAYEYGLDPKGTFARLMNERKAARRKREPRWRTHQGRKPIRERRTYEE